MTLPTESFDTRLNQILVGVQAVIDPSISTGEPMSLVEAKQAIRELVLSEIGDGEVHVSHVCPSDSIPCREFAARGALRNELRARINGGKDE